MVADEVITTGELLPLVGTDRVRLIDAREPDAYREGHIPGSVNLHPSVLEHMEVHDDGEEVDHQLRPASEVVAHFRAFGVRSDVPVCVYDEGGGYLAARVWWMLDYLGHRRPRLLDGGLVAWIVAGGLLDVGPAPFSVGSFVQRLSPTRRLEFPDVIAGMADPNTVLCNTLTADEFRVESIPGSINIPYTDTFAPDNFPLLKSRHELESVFAGHGITHRQRLVCYCRIGYSASQIYLAARYAGLSNVTVYDGSMVDWAARGGELVPGNAGS
ncbi:MAG: rhodanese-like domain-containing protein [Spirochaetia bacterium]